MRSIEDSKFYIIVFSKNYASSSWCLDELVKIMECQKTNEHTAYPVFYDVEPTEVHNQSGAVGEAFAKHVNEEATARWRDALKEAAGRAGWELKTFDGLEAKLIQKIVEEISLELRFTDKPSVDENLIGMETRVEDVVLSLETDIDDVRMIGIKGMGGAGKTTLARAVYDQISFRFEGSSFVENVREISKNPFYGLKSLQKQVLSDVLNEQDITVSGVYEGKKTMKKRMCRRKVLLVLDDVDQLDQLEALAGERNWFKAGSRVIITTRDEQVLAAHQVNLILDVNLLSYKEAICLFNRYAFGTGIPIQMYEELSKQVVCYANGLPLTIKVLGSFLCGKHELEWTDALERLKTIPLKETLEMLELSYNSLEEDYKEIFLDVACLLKGWKKERAITALESCGFHAINGLKVLELKSLITVNDSGCLSMHDHIEEMGKNIVRRLHPNEPYKHSRLWMSDEIMDVFCEERGTEVTRCIKIKHMDPIYVMQGLRNMKELRFLQYDSDLLYYTFQKDFDCPLPLHDDFDDVGEDRKYLPNGLRYLCWNCYPFMYLPKNFQANNLVGLVMHFCNIVLLWEGGERKVLKKLRFIDLRCCKLRTLDISQILNLESLKLEQCENLVELHMPVGSFKLKLLNIYHSILRSLDLSWAENLVTLKVEYCNDLVELHMPLKGLKLKHLCLKSSKLKTLNLTRTLNLESIDLRLCHDLEELHMPAENFNLKSFKLHYSKIRFLDLVRALNLDTLIVQVCKDLIELHMPVHSPKLKHNKIECSKLKILNLMQNHNLEMLDLSQCEDLLELHMPNESPKLKTINIHCSKLRTLYLGLSPYLESLNLRGCFNLVKIQAPVGCLSGRVTFKPFLLNQGFPMINSLAELHLTARSFGICPLHPDNNLPKFHFECNYKELLLSSAQIKLTKLLSFSLCACTNLASLSVIFCGLQCLSKLTLEGAIPEVPKELDQLKRLEELNLLSANI